MTWSWFVLSSGVFYSCIWSNFTRAAVPSSERPPFIWRFYLVTYRYLSAWSQSTAFAEEVECCVFMFQKWWAIAYFLIFLFWNNRIEKLPSLRQKTVRMAREKLARRPGTPRWSMRTKMAISWSSPFRPIRLVQLAVSWAIDDLLFAILCWWDVAYRGHIKVYCTLSPQHASKCQHVFLWSRASSENFRTLDQNLETVSAVESSGGFFAMYKIRLERLILGPV